MEEFSEHASVQETAALTTATDQEDNLLISKTVSPGINETVALLLRSPTLQLFILTCLYNGMSLGFISAAYPPALVSPLLGDRWVGYVAACFYAVNSAGILAQNLFVFVTYLVLQLRMCSDGWQERGDGGCL